jgi:hypothetical protein
MAHVRQVIEVAGADLFLKFVTVSFLAAPRPDAGDTLSKMFRSLKAADRTRSTLRFLQPNRFLCALQGPK